MMYYMGQEFDKEKCKEYKTLNAAEKAAEKQKAAVFDEAGGMVADFRPAATMTNDVPDGALEENEDGSVQRSPGSKGQREDQKTLQGRNPRQK